MTNKYFIYMADILVATLLLHHRVYSHEA